ncbi:MAG: FAD:protein FMN transferase [Oscillospiraceae bacterium]|nr:FAD:protein FMN transferase [Oscillospiraceae bacterium]
MKHTSICCKLLTLTLLLSALTGCGSKEPEKTEKQIFAMDTVMTLTAYGEAAGPALDAAAAQINETARLLDPEQEGSLVWTLNHSGGAQTEIPELLYHMLDTAGTVYARSGGALDLSVYPVVRTWGFIDQAYRVPSPDEIAAAMEGVDYAAVTFEQTGDTCFAAVPDGMEISFGSVAKGAMSDAVVDTLRENGVTSAVISLGGNVQTLGLRPDGSDWTVAVQDPHDTGTFLGTIAVGETAVVTSGSYQRYFEENGMVYHHIIDPATGYPADSGLLSATVVCPDGAMADCLSTAMFVLGEDGALDYWRTWGGFELLLVTTDGRVVLTDGLRDAFTANGDRYTIVFTD